MARVQSSSGCDERPVDDDAGVLTRMSTWPKAAMVSRSAARRRPSSRRRPAHTASPPPRDSRDDGPGCRRWRRSSPRPWHRRGRGAWPRPCRAPRAAGDDGGLSREIHPLLPDCFRFDDARAASAPDLGENNSSARDRAAGRRATPACQRFQALLALLSAFTPRHHPGSFVPGRADAARFTFPWGRKSRVPRCRRSPSLSSLGRRHQLRRLQIADVPHGSGRHAARHRGFVAGIFGERHEIVVAKLMNNCCTAAHRLDKGRCCLRRFFWIADQVLMAFACSVLEACRSAWSSLLCFRFLVEFFLVTWPGL